MNAWKLAQRDSIQIFSTNEQQIILARGKKPRRCSGPKVHQAKTGGLELRCGCRELREHSGGLCDAYMAVLPVRPVRGPRLTDFVQVMHRDGTDCLRVQRLKDLADNSFLSQPGDGVIGSSQDFSLEEAFKDAIKRIGPALEKEPGMVEVISMGALYGGITGFSRLFVKVERSAIPELLSGVKK